MSCVLLWCVAGSSSKTSDLPTLALLLNRVLCWHESGKSSSKTSNLSKRVVLSRELCRPRWNSSKSSDLLNSSLELISELRWHEIGRSSSKSEDLPKLAFVFNFQLRWFEIEGSSTSDLLSKLDLVFSCELLSHEFGTSPKTSSTNSSTFCSYGVSPSLFFLLFRAPFMISTSATSSCPFATAWCKGVQPSESCMLTLTPASASNFTATVFPSATLSRSSWNASAINVIKWTHFKYLLRDHRLQCEFQK